MDFHCFCCGEKLHEIGLGFYECGKCGGIYLPSLDNEKRQTLTKQEPVSLYEPM